MRVPVNISVIIVTWNGLDILKKCLQSLEGAGGNDGTREIVVVDNASADGTADWVTHRHPKIRLIRNPENYGFARAVNQGIRACSGEYIVLLNNDTEVRGDALATMAGCMHRDSRIGALACKLLNPDGSLQPSINRTFPGLGHLLLIAFGLQAGVHAVRRSQILRGLLARHYDRLHLKARAIAWAGGACLMVRRRVIEEVGLLDEGFFFFQEDVDWCRRMSNRGWVVAYTPDAQVIHAWGASTSRATAEIIARLYMSQWHYYDKYYSGLPRALAKTLFSAGLRLRWTARSIMLSRRDSDQPDPRVEGYRLALERL